MAVSYDVGSIVAQSRPTPEGLRLAGIFRALRADASLTQEEVARRVGLTLSGYRGYEQGKRQFRTEQMPVFAAAFEVSVDALAARLGLHGANIREIHVAECADIMGELADEPPEVAATVMNWLRESVNLIKMRRTRRDN